MSSCFTPSFSSSSSAFSLYEPCTLTKSTTSIPQDISSCGYGYGKPRYLELRDVCDEDDDNCQFIEDIGEEYSNSLGLRLPQTPWGSPSFAAGLFPTPPESPALTASDILPPHLRLDLSFERWTPFSTPPLSESYSSTSERSEFSWGEMSPPPLPMGALSSPHLFPISLPPSPLLLATEIHPTTSSSYPNVALSQLPPLSKSNLSLSTFDLPPASSSFFFNDMPSTPPEEASTSVASVLFASKSSAIKRGKRRASDVENRCLENEMDSSDNGCSARFISQNLSDVEEESSTVQKRRRIV